MDSDPSRAHVSGRHPRKAERGSCAACSRRLGSGDLARLKRIHYGFVALPRSLERGEGLDLQDGAVDELRQLGGISEPSPALTLKPVSHQRRARRSQTHLEPIRRDTIPASDRQLLHNEGP